MKRAPQALLIISLFVVMLTLCMSCGSLDRLAPKLAGELFQKASTDSQRADQWEFFKQATPAQLQLLEGLLSLAPDDKNLLATLVKGHFTYAFLVLETQLLNEELSSKGGTPSLNLASLRSEVLLHHTRALRFGFRYLKIHGLDYKSLLEAPILTQLLASKFNPDDEQALETLFFLAEGWSSLINLQRNNPKWIAQLPMAKGVMDFVCGHRPDFFYGGCDLFYGLYETSRPPLLGGNPQKGRDYFQKAILRFPDNLLARILLIQFSMIPLEEKELYTLEKKKLEVDLSSFDEKRYWNPSSSLPLDPSSESASLMNLLNATALKRWEIMKHYEEKLFE